MSACCVWSQYVAGSECERIPTDSERNATTGRHRGVGAPTVGMAISVLSAVGSTMTRRVEAVVNYPAGSDSHTDTAERERREAALDETIEQSFPASDPPSSDPNPDDHDAITPETSEDDT